MAVIHISEADAARDFASLLARVRAGEEVRIGPEAAPVAVLKPADGPHIRTLSESLRLLKERGSTVTLDGGFEQDLEDVIASHPEPLNPPEWD
jgi:antitoxin (DNA-binding transcriptional repressor) of toxin-antitoxin stability system